MKISDAQQEILDITFSTKSEQLPTIDFLKERNIVFDNERFKPDTTFNTIIFRATYVKHSFVCLTHEWMTELVSFTNKFNKVSELSCGAGWFTHWLRKYGQPVSGHCVDDFSWNDMKYQKWVKKIDSIKHVKKSKDVDLFILCWPYMDDVAFKIWSVMQPKQSLLYIGEGYGGCTANELFFDAVEGHEVNIENKRIYNKFKSFYAVHDYPALYVKK